MDRDGGRGSDWESGRVERNMEMEEGMEGEGGGEGVRGVRERDRGIEIEG